MSKFKVGDYVRCVEGSNFFFGREGEVYRVDVGSTDRGLRLEEMLYTEPAVDPDRFELITDPAYSNIDCPAHYNTGRIEVIDAIEDWKLDFHLGNVVKYVARAGKKTPDREEDLRKAAYYIQRALQKETV